MKRKKYKKRKFFDKFSYSNRNTNIFLICSFLFVLFGLTIGYSVLSNVLSIKGDVAIRPFKDIRITSVTGPEISNGAYETYNFKYSHDLLVVNGVLPNTSSSLTYDIDPKAPVHIVVIPKKHIASAAEISADNSGEVAHIYEAIARIAEELKLEKGFRVVTNCGEEGGQSVGHLHFHLLAGRNLGWPPG